MQIGLQRQFPPILIVLASCIFIFTPFCHSQESAPDTLHVTTRHPEFGIGQYAVGLKIAYGSVSGTNVTNIDDANEFNLSLKWRADNKIVPQATIEFRNKDSILVSFSSGLTLYWSDPTQYKSVVNPDGELGKPSLVLTSIARFGESSGSSASWSAQGTVIVPVQEHLSVILGATYRKEDEVSDHDDIFGGVKIYSSSYLTDSPYENPDGRLGSVAFELLAGKSSEGEFGSIKTCFPMSSNMTLTVLSQYDRDKISSRRTLTAGLGLSFFIH